MESSYSDHHYYMLNKPFQMVSQFVSPHKVRLLGDLDFIFPEGTHAIGRLDNNSEGLLLLTTNKKLTRLLFSGIRPHKRNYLVKVNNVLSPENESLLRNGVSIRIKGGQFYATPPCEVKTVPDPQSLYPYADTSVTHGPHTWLMISLYEGKYRQVRKMMAAVHHRCKRLIRISIEDLELGDLPPGEIREIGEEELFTKLKIETRQGSGK